MVAQVEGKASVQNDLCERIDEYMAAGDDSRVAAEKTISWLQKTGQFQSLGPSLALRGMMDIWRTYIQRRRAHIIFSSTMTQDGDRPMVGRWSDMEFLMENRKMHLAEMTKDQVIQQSGFYHYQAATNQRKGDFLWAIAQRLPDDKTVGEILSDDDIEAIWKQASPDI